MGNGGYPFFFTVSLYELSCSAVDMRRSRYCECQCVLPAHDWILLHSSLLHLWLQTFGVCPTNDRSTSVISMFHHWECCLSCREVTFNCVQMMAASSFTHNPDLLNLGVLQCSLCSNGLVELYAWMVLNPKKEQIDRKPQCRIQWVRNRIRRKYEDGS